MPSLATSSGMPPDRGGVGSENLLARSRFSTWVRPASMRSTRRSSCLALRARFSVLARMESASDERRLISRASSSEARSRWDWSASRSASNLE